MFKKNMLAAAMALAIGAGAPVSSQALEASPGGVGDVLVAPLFVTAGQWETRLQVINTDSERSVVAKVAFWKGDDTEEVRDFFVFLSPGDMWEGKITHNPDGGSILTSSDDSVLRAPKVFADASNPFQVTLPADFGYVTIVMSKSFDLGPAVVGKQTILDVHPIDEGEGTVIGGLDTINSLTGVVIVENPANGLQMSQQMTAFKDCMNSTPLSISRVTTLTGDCLGETGAIEAVLAKKHVGFPFQWGPGGLPATIGIFNFPTKNERVGSNTVHPEFLQAKGGADTVGVTYDMIIRDMEERIMTGLQPPPPEGPIVSPKPKEEPEPAKPEFAMVDETQILFLHDAIPNGVDDPAIAANFTKGWAEFVFRKDANDGSYVGAPVIPSYIYWEAHGNKLRGYWENAASW